MTSRREFLKAGALTASLATARLGLADTSARQPQDYFGLHPFIEANPKAVFVRRTNVPDKMDEDAKRREGLALAREIFVPMDRPGVPISHRIVLKPNSTSIHERSRPDVENWGTGTDPQFYEGMVMGLKEVGLKKFHFVEANDLPTWNVRGYVDINERLGVEMNEPYRRPRQLQRKLGNDLEQGAGRRGFQTHPALCAGQ